MRLLLVEDDYLLTNGLSAQLEKAGFSVDTARTAREARHLGQQESYRAGILDPVSYTHLTLPTILLV